MFVLPAPAVFLLSNYEVLSRLDVSDSGRVVLQEHLQYLTTSVLSRYNCCLRQMKALTRAFACPVRDPVIIVLRGVLRKQERTETALFETHSGCAVAAPGL